MNTNTNEFFLAVIGLPRIKVNEKLTLWLLNRMGESVTMLSYDDEADFEGSEGCIYLQKESGGDVFQLGAFTSSLDSMHMLYKHMTDQEKLDYSNAIIDAESADSRTSVNAESWARSITALRTLNLVDTV